MNPLPCTQMDSYLRSVGINFDDEEEEAAAANDNDVDGDDKGQNDDENEVVTMEEDSWS